MALKHMTLLHWIRNTWRMNEFLRRKQGGVQHLPQLLALLLESKIHSPEVRAGLLLTCPPFPPTTQATHIPDASATGGGWKASATASSIAAGENNALTGKEGATAVNLPPLPSTTHTTIGPDTSARGGCSICHCSQRCCQ